MVSNLPLMAIKFKDYSVKGNLPKLLLVVLAVVAAIFLKLAGGAGGLRFLHYRIFGVPGRVTGPVDLN
jgi:hypothetical protein